MSASGPGRPQRAAGSSCACRDPVRRVHRLGHGHRGLEMLERPWDVALRAGQATEPVMHRAEHRTPGTEHHHVVGERLEHLGEQIDERVVRGLRRGTRAQMRSPAEPEVVPLQPGAVGPQRLTHDLARLAGPTRLGARDGGEREPGPVLLLRRGRLAQAGHELGQAGLLVADDEEVEDVGPDDVGLLELPAPGQRTARPLLRRAQIAVQRRLGGPQRHRPVDVRGAAQLGARRARTRRAPGRSRARDRSAGDPRAGAARRGGGDAGSRRTASARPSGSRARVAHGGRRARASATGGRRGCRPRPRRCRPARPRAPARSGPSVPRGRGPCSRARRRDCSAPGPGVAARSGPRSSNASSSKVSTHGCSWTASVHGPVAATPMSASSSAFPSARAKSAATTYASPGLFELPTVLEGASQAELDRPERSGAPTGRCARDPGRARTTAPLRRTRSAPRPRRPRGARSGRPSRDRRVAAPPRSGAPGRPHSARPRAGPWPRAPSRPVRGVAGAPAPGSRCTPRCGSARAGTRRRRCRRDTRPAGARPGSPPPRRGSRRRRDRTAAARRSAETCRPTTVAVWRTSPSPLGEPGHRRLTMRARPPGQSSGASLRARRRRRVSIRCSSSSRSSSRMKSGLPRVTVAIVGTRLTSVCTASGGAVARNMARTSVWSKPSTWTCTRRVRGASRSISPRRPAPSSSSR